MFSPQCFRHGPLRAARPLIGVCIHPGHQMWASWLLIGVCTTRGFGHVNLGNQAADQGAHWPGLQVCAVVAHLVFTFQGLREWGCKSLRLLQRIP